MIRPITQISEAVKKVIAHQSKEHPQILQWLGDWSIEHETQVNLSPDMEVDREYFDSEGQQYWNVRIPKGAMTDNPTFFDRGITEEVLHWYQIGTTGWNWVQKKSMWVGFDFDANTGHKAGHTRVCTPEQLKEVRTRLLEYPNAILRTSTSGNGLHLIIPVAPWIPTRTHTEHSEFAKHIRDSISETIHLDLSAFADVGGGNFWHWRKGLRQYALQRIYN